MKHIFHTLSCCYFFYITLPVFAQPNIIPNLVLWLSADSVHLSGGNFIDTVYDLSGNNNHAVQNNFSLQPTLVNSVDSLNFNPSMRFDGTGDILLINNPVMVGEIFVIASWRGGQMNFPDYNGIITRQSGNDIDILFIGEGNTTNLYSAGFLGNNIYLNGLQSLNFFPLNRYKIISGRKSLAGLFDNLLLGSDRQCCGGRYWNGDIVEVIIYSQELTSVERNAVMQYLNNKYAPPVNLGADITVNYGFCPVKLNAHKDWFTSYQWSTGATADSLIVTKPGEYSVSVLNTFNFPSSDTIKVIYPGNFRPFGDTTICYGDTLLWNTQLSKSGYTFLWQDGSTDSVFYITQAGQYYVQVTDSFGCNRISDTITVSIDSFPLLNFLNDDTSFCKGNSITTLIPAEKYLWSTGDTTSNIPLQTPNLYSVTITNSLGCTTTDSINVTIVGIAPTANFSASEVCLGESTQFADTSVSPDGSQIISWLWNFGDNAADSLSDTPTHLYAVAGNFSVSLTVTTDSGCSNSITKNVIVHSSPVANFSVLTNPLCSRSEIEFSDNSISADGIITNIIWNFTGNAADTSSESSPVFIYDSSGTFAVSLFIVSEYGCSDDTVRNITVHPSPLADFFSVSGCEGDSVKFSDNSLGIIKNYLWDFGNNNSSVLAHPSTVYNVAGTYNVSLTVSTVFGCTDSFSDSVKVYPAPTAYFNSTDFCRGTPVQAFDQSMVTQGEIVAWEWNVFQTSISSTAQNPYFVFGENSLNNYLMKLKVFSSQGCSNVYDTIISIHNSPIADFTFSPSIGEPPLEVSFENLSDSALAFSWSFGTGDTSILQNPSYTFTDSGEFKIQLVAFSQFGCADTVAKNLQVRKPALDIAVTKVRTSEINGYLKVFADVYNTGNTEVQSFEIIAKLLNRPSVKESWSGSLGEKTELSYAFNASFEITDATMPDAVCVRIEKPNAGNDENIFNNEMCISFSDFKILNLYPNPAADEIFLEYVLTGKSEKAEFVIYDALGKKIEEIKSENGRKGLHKIAIDVSGLRNGIYAMKLIYGDKYEVKRFTKY